MPKIIVVLIIRSVPCKKYLNLFTRSAPSLDIRGRNVILLCPESSKACAGSCEGERGGRHGVRLGQGGHVVDQDSGLEGEARPAAERDPLPRLGEGEMTSEFWRPALVILVRF